MAEPYLHIYKAEMTEPLIRRDVGMLSRYDSKANRFGAKLYHEGGEVTLAGSTAAGYFIAPNGETIRITGVVSGNLVYVDLPKSCYYYEGACTVTVKITQGDLTQTVLICDGIIQKSITDDVVEPDNVVEPSRARRTRTVGANGMYQTIQAAVDASNDGDTIIVAPGVYVERLKVHKNVKILGENRNKCILQSTVEDYNNPPLEMSEGEFGNFQVFGYDGGEPIDGKSLAYCLHIENDNSSGSSLYIHDVDFTNYVMQTVGIGMRNSFSLRFDDCTFTCMADLAAFYCHSCIFGGIDQNLYLNRCMFRNGGTQPIIRMQSQNISGAYALCEWVDCKTIPRATEVVEMVNWDGSSGHGGWLGSADWHISGFSMGNNIAKLNAWGV